MRSLGFSLRPVASERQAAEELGQFEKWCEEHSINLVELLNAGRERVRKVALENAALKKANAASKIESAVIEGRTRGVNRGRAAHRVRRGAERAATRRHDQGG
jgi:hypothetical protein